MNNQDFKQILNEALKNVATKDDLKNLATKDDLKTLKEEHEGYFTAIKEDLNVIDKKLDRLDGIEKKLDSVEKLARATFALLVDEDKKKKAEKPSVELIKTELKEYDKRLKRVEKKLGIRPMITA